MVITVAARSTPKIRVTTGERSPINVEALALMSVVKFAGKVIMLNIGIFRRP